MKNLRRRLTKLESARFDSTGLEPRSEAWFEYYGDIFDRMVRGENPECATFPIEVFDHWVEAAERAEAEERAAAAR
jgi:hypothetical protein